jgi:ribonuclease BN (tRNA processing enzyme)
MKLTVLGCHGGELPRCRSTCFLVDGVLAIDAGSLTSTLSLEELVKVDSILLTHSHFDHVKDLPLMSDLVIGRRDQPVTIFSSQECTATLKKNMFNDVLWPDFTRIKNGKKTPVLKLKSFKAGATFKIGRYTVKSIPVSHPVESCGFVISDGTSTMAISGDTGPTDRLWKVLNQTKGLKALLLETSFPNRMQALADISGHLTPQTLAAELGKFERNGCEVLLYHLKPAFVTQLKDELKHLPVQVLELGDAFEF